MYKVKKNPSYLPFNKFYRNVAFYHLPKPRLKSEVDMVDGHPIIFVEIGAAQ